VLQRLGEPLAEAIASAETARAAFQAAAAAKPKKGKTETASQQAGGGGGGGGSGGGGGGGGGSNSANSAGGGSATVNNNERDEKVSRLVARGPDGTRGFHTTESGKRWTGVEAWVVRQDTTLLSLSLSLCLSLSLARPAHTTPIPTRNSLAPVTCDLPVLSHSFTPVAGAVCVACGMRNVVLS
jgi:hypothetical protein